MSPIIVKLRRLHRQSLVSSYDLAVCLRDVYETGAWKETGAKTFGSFCKAEFGWCRNYAMKIIRISARFSRKDVETLGLGKLRVLIGLPDHLLKEALAAAYRGDSKTFLERNFQKPMQNAKIISFVAEQDVVTTLARRALALSPADKTRLLQAFLEPMPDNKRIELATWLIQTTKRVKRAA